jgi:hypothetical protein
MPTPDDATPISEEPAARILAARAERLAAPPPAPGEAALAALAFDAGAERYAVPLAAVLRVERAVGFARLPGAPPGHLGLVNLDGRPCPLVDVPALLGVPGAAPAPRKWAVVLGGRAPDVALAADAVGIEQVPLDLLGGAAGPRLGVTADARVILDPAALLGDAAEGERGAP